MDKLAKSGQITDVSISIGKDKAREGWESIKFVAAREAKRVRASGGLLVVTTIGPPIDVDDIDGTCSCQVAKRDAASTCGEGFGVGGGPGFWVGGGPGVANGGGNAGGGLAGFRAVGGKIYFPTSGSKCGFKVLNFAVIQ